MLLSVTAASNCRVSGLVSGEGATSLAEQPVRSDATGVMTTGSPAVCVQAQVLLPEAPLAITAWSGTVEPSSQLGARSARAWMPAAWR
jgi:hypothetical protein